MKLKNIKGAIFDLDGTLTDSLALWDMIWNACGERFCEGGKFRPSTDVDKAVRTMLLKDAMDYVHSIYKIGSNGEELLQISNDIIKNFYLNDVKLKTGALDFLEYCKTKGIKMCIASATEQSLMEIAAEHCGIKKYFTAILSCADIGKGKGYPDVYLKALDVLNTSAEETCVFEDSHVAIDTVDKIGMRTVGIYDKDNYGHDQIKKIATIYIDEGESLKKLVEQDVF